MQKPKWYLTFSASAAGNDWIHANPVARAAKSLESPVR